MTGAVCFLAEVALAHQLRAIAQCAARFVLSAEVALLRDRTSNTNAGVSFPFREILAEDFGPC